MKTCKARRHLQLVKPGAAAPDPFDEALNIALRAMETGVPESEAAMIFARAHCAAYGCPGCFQEGTSA